MKIRVVGIPSITADLVVNAFGIPLTINKDLTELDGAHLKDEFAVN